VISRDSINGPFPSKRLGEVVEFLDSKRRPVTESDRRAGPYPYYGANGIQGTIDDFIFDEPLVLLAEDRGHFGEPDRGIAYRISGKTWVNNHAHVLRPTSAIDLAYLCRILENYDVTPFVTGTTRGKLTKAGASEIVIPLPPLAEQRRIAEVLDRAEALRAKRRTALAQLDSLTQSLFLDVFGDPARNSKGLPTIPLGKLGEWSSGGTPPRGRDDYFHGSVPWFSSGELEDMVVTHSREHLTLAALRETTAKPVPKGSLLLGMYDTAALKASIAGVDCSCNQAIAFATIDPAIAEAVFVYFAIVIGREHFRRLQRGVRQKNLNLSMVREISIPRPPLSQQREFAQRVTAVEKLKMSHSASSSELDALFASVQDRAFRGQLAFQHSHPESLADTKPATR
jgi:type I restriction enzyme S subunit